MSQAGVTNIGAAVGVVDFLEGNTGGPVGPNASNIIFVVGDGSISVQGNPGTNTLTIVDAGLTQWTRISASQTLAINSGYFCVGGGVLQLQLPATAPVGSQISIVLKGSTGWQITQAAGQQISIGNLATTAGATGSMSSTQQGDTVMIVCDLANLSWTVISSMGNPVVV